MVEFAATLFVMIVLAPIVLNALGYIFAACLNSITNMERENKPK